MFLYAQVRWKEWQWSRNYYRDRRFWKIEKKMRARYRWKNPYAMARKEGQVYGETPLALYDEIAKRVGLEKGERFLDLGCGRGRGCYFLAHFYGCKALGIEMVAGFVKRAIAVPGVEILQGDFLSCDLNADVIYLYGTCLNDEEIEVVSKNVVGAKVVSVSEPLPGAPVIESFEGEFPWGKTQLYIQKF
ncbi:MAG: methionine biosynthesis protein MetW [Simkaniaceae bacterium]|nr:methionine biosynthesis protein MetW [Simkaniaceae bacterium]